MTYKELFEYSIEELNKVGILEAESDTRVLFSYLLNADRGFLFMHGEDEVPKEDLDSVLEAIVLRKQRIPVQHITGYQNFMGLEFKVNDNVLIPRFDTECLVEEAMLLCNDGDKVLDVCTGSGCILLSLMKYKNDIDGYGVDISSKALDVAKENISVLMNDELCKPTIQTPTFIESDLFSEIYEKDFDIIVSNPPYIRSDVINGLEPEVKDYDPMLALDGGEDGLIFYRRITKEAREYLKKNGYLLVEIGNDQADDVKSLFETNGYRDVKVVKDLCGNDRVVLGKL